MATDDRLSSEHAFVPGDKTMTAVFPSRELAQTALSAISSMGIGSGEVQLVTDTEHQPRSTESPGFKEDTPGVEGFDEIAHVLTETFSDDDKAYVEFDRTLTAGGALLN